MGVQVRRKGLGRASVMHIQETYSYSRADAIVLTAQWQSKKFKKVLVFSCCGCRIYAYQP